MIDAEMYGMMPGRTRRSGPEHHRRKRSRKPKTPEPAAKICRRAFASTPGVGMWDPRR
jgi:hypothetical protein